MNATYSLGRSLLAAGLILGASALLTWLTPAHISRELSHRLLGALLSAVVVVYANAVPKALTARARQRCSPAAEQAARRFAGWCLVLGGIGNMLAWLLAPIEMANLLAASLLGIALLLAVLRCMRLGTGAKAT